MKNKRKAKHEQIDIPSNCIKSKHITYNRRHETKTLQRKRARETNQNLYKNDNIIR